MAGTTEHKLAAKYSTVSAVSGHAVCQHHMWESHLKRLLFSFHFPSHAVFPACRAKLSRPQSGEEFISYLA